jgi:hypothetical protein
VFGFKLDREPLEAVRRSDTGRWRLAFFEQPLDVREQLSQSLAGRLVYTGSARKFRMQSCQGLLEGWGGSVA